MGLLTDVYCSDKGQNNDTRGDDAVMEASIEKSRYDDMSRNKDSECVDQALS